MRTIQWFKRVAVGLAASVAVAAAVMLARGEIFSQFLLYEVLPGYKPEPVVMFKFFEDERPVVWAMGESDEPLDVQTVFAFSNEEEPQRIVIEDGQSFAPVIGTSGVIFQSEEYSEDNPLNNSTANGDDYTLLSDPEYLRKNFYAFDRNTAFNTDDFSAFRFLAADLTINRKTGGPKILIFHTHAYEGYVDSNPEKLEDGVVGLGARLAKILNEEYGLSVLHVTKRFDMEDGKVNVNGAYERVEPYISQILAENPTIEVVIDLHRDGINDNQHLVSTIDGKPTAPLMFVNGLSKILDDGALTNISSLPNPYLSENLAFSFNMYLEGNKLYKGLMRRNYIKAYRYSLHMRPKSLLVEVGAQTNTMEEARNAIEPLSKILTSVILE